MPRLPLSNWWLNGGRLGLTSPFLRPVAVGQGENPWVLVLEGSPKAVLLVAAAQFLQFEN